MAEMGTGIGSSMVGTGLPPSVVRKTPTAPSASVMLFGSASLRVTVPLLIVAVVPDP